MVSKLEMNVFAHILATLARSTWNNLYGYKNRTANAVKPVWKPANEHLRPYFGNGTSDRLKIISNVLKIEQRMP